MKVNGKNQISENGYLRIFDTEYKLVEQYAVILGSNIDATGTIVIVSEREVCPSCDNVIKAFSRDYYNLQIIVIDGYGNMYRVKGGIIIEGEQ